MTDDQHQVDTITHLRGVIKDLQAKLEYRTIVLAQVVPHLETWSLESGYEGSSASYISEEILQKYGEYIQRFKDEYAKEIQLGKDGKL